MMDNGFFHDPEYREKRSELISELEDENVNKYFKIILKNSLNDVRFPEKSYTLAGIISNVNLLLNYELPDEDGSDSE
jgi:hypothetical protein